MMVSLSYDGSISDRASRSQDDCYRKGVQVGEQHRMFAIVSADLQNELRHTTCDCIRFGHHL